MQHNSLVDRRQYAALSECVYLNQASLGLIDEKAVHAMHAFLDDTARQGNLHMTDVQETGFFDSLREVGAQTLGCPESQLAILASASDLLNQLPALLDLPPEGEILVVDSDFPALTRPRLHHLAGRREQLLFAADDPKRPLTEVLCEALSPRTAAVIVSHVQFSTGSRVAIDSLRAASESVGARLVVDVTQSAGALPMEASQWRADAVVCSGYKWLGGHGGVALAALSDELIARVPPAPGWMGAPDPFDFDATRLALAPDARRFTQSTMAYISLVGLKSALQHRQTLNNADVLHHADELSDYLIERVAPLGWSPFRQRGPGAAPHIVAIGHAAVLADDAVSQLKRDAVICSSRNNRLRVSLATYNTRADIDALVESLAKLERGGA